MYLILHPKLLNLLGIPSSKNQIKLLNKGLKFTPTSKPKIPEMKKRYKRFHKEAKAKQ